MWAAVLEFLAQDVQVVVGMFIAASRIRNGFEMSGRVT